MKKIIALILCLALSFSFVACQNTPSLTEDDLDRFMLSNQISDTIYGYTFEMSIPEGLGEDYIVTMNADLDHISYSFYDLINAETDGGYLMSLTFRNDYPSTEEEIAAYEEGFTAVGQSKILYGTPEQTFFAVANTASDVQYDITNEEKTLHYQELLRALMADTETFIVTKAN